MASGREPAHETVAPAEFERSIEVFARGFSFARSFTHPYMPERLSPNGTGSSTGTLWALRDADRRTGAYRKKIGRSATASRRSATGWAVPSRS